MKINPLLAYTIIAIVGIVATTFTLSKIDADALTHNAASEASAIAALNSNQHNGIYVVKTETNCAIYIQSTSTKIIPCTSFKIIGDQEIQDTVRNLQKILRINKLINSKGEIDFAAVANHVVTTYGKDGKICTSNELNTMLSDAGVNPILRTGIYVALLDKGYFKTTSQKCLNQSDILKTLIAYGS